MKRFLVLAKLFLLLPFLHACGKSVSPNVYSASEVGVVSRVISGVIIAKRPVKIDTDIGVGTLAGAGMGAAGGSAMGGSNTRGNIAGAVGGALIGGVVGTISDKALHRRHGFEYIIKLKNDSTIAVTQAQDVTFDIHQRVLVIYGAMTRIIPETTVGI